MQARGGEPQYGASMAADHDVGGVVIRAGEVPGLL
jgi:hypothetical protein